MKAISLTERVNLVWDGLFGILDDPNRTSIKNSVGRMPLEGGNMNEVRCLQVMVVYAVFESAIGPGVSVNSAAGGIIRCRASYSKSLPLERPCLPCCRAV